MVDIIKKLIARFTSFQGSIFISSIAYSLVLSVAPILIVLNILFAQDIVFYSYLMQLIANYIPYEYLKLINDYLGMGITFNYFELIFIMGIAIWILSKGIYHFLLYGNNEYELKHNDVILRILSVVICIFLIGVAIGLYLLLTNVFRIYTLLILLLILFIEVYFFYKSICFFNYQIKRIFPLSILITLLLILISYIFYIYIAYIANYNSIYGPLNSIVVLLLSCYIVANILFFGYCINLKVNNVTNAKMQYTKILKWSNEKWILLLKKLESMVKG